MNRLLFGVACLGLAFATGCASDPTADLRTGAARVQTTRTYLQLVPGDSASVTARTLDNQGNPIAPLPTVSSSDAAVATAAVDSVITANPSPRLNFFVKGVAPGEAVVSAAAEGVTETADITTLVFPETFPGSASVNSTGRTDVVTVTADPVVEFDTSGTSEVLVDGASADVLSLTSTEMVFSWSAAAAVAEAEVTITDVLFLGQFPTTLVLADPVALTQDDDEPANDTDVPAGGTLTTATFGIGVINRGSSASDDGRDFWCVTVPAGDNTFRIGWGGTGEDADIDVFVLSGCTGSFSYGGDITGFAMATGANPESWDGAAMTAGAYMILIEVYDPHDVPDPFYYQIEVFPTPS
jgi:hypothetical protein